MRVKFLLRFLFVQNTAGICEIKNLVAENILPLQVVLRGLYTRAAPRILLLNVPNYVQLQFQEDL